MAFRSRAKTTHLVSRTLLFMVQSSMRPCLRSMQTASLRAVSFLRDDDLSEGKLMASRACCVAGEHGLQWRTSQ